jgi:hypothetical protein
VAHRATDIATQSAWCGRFNELCTCVQIAVSSILVSRRWAELEDECSALSECMDGGDNKINARHAKVGRQAYEQRAYDYRQQMNGDMPVAANRKVSNTVWCVSNNPQSKSGAQGERHRNSVDPVSARSFVVLCCCAHMGRSSATCRRQQPKSLRTTINCVQMC